VKDLAAKAKSFKIGAGKDEGTDLGPVCYKELKDRIIKLVATASKEGATVVLDGTQYVHPKYPQGNFIAPTIIDNVTK
jgi:malonate-semialdehyde dehydrogenase (acetylating)/methylmalonate-semialdehyde dehydrogenase